jgi:hypothetical protein
MFPAGSNAGNSCAGIQVPTCDFLVSTIKILIGFILFVGTTQDVGQCDGKNECLRVSGFNLMPVPAGFRLEKSGLADGGGFWQGASLRARRSLRTASIARVAGRGLPALPFQRRRRGIFIEPQPEQNSSPVGAAYSVGEHPREPLVKSLAPPNLRCRS